MKKIIEYFANNPLIVNVITIFVFISGILTYQSLQKQAFPMVDEGGITMITTYPGASPEDVELNVTIPIEDELKTIQGIEEYFSYSFENYSRINVIFDPDDSKNFEKIKNDIRRSLDGIEDFPSEVTKKPKIYTWGPIDMPIIRIGIKGINLSEKKLQLRAKELKDKLLNIGYVSKVTETGMRDREVHIKINLDKMNQYYLSFDDITNAIKSHNIQVTSGTLKSYTSEKNIVTISRFKNILDVKNVIIRSRFDGRKIVLSDIAEVIDTFEHERERFRFNGNQGIILDVYKKTNSDVIKISEKVKEEIEKFNSNFKDEIKSTILLDMSEPTRVRINVLSNNAIFGLIFVIIILFLFLNFKNAFWSSLGIPFSIFFSFIFLPFFGVTINSISLLGMIIVLGMIVDDAIVISENIYRHKLMGHLDKKGTVTATMEVAHAVLTTILTTIIAFMPLIIMKGVVGSYAREIPIIIGLILIGSLFESLLILPGHLDHKLNKTAKIILGVAVGGILGFALTKFYKLSLLYIIIITSTSGLIFSLIFTFIYKEDKDSKEKRFIIVLKKWYENSLKYILKFRWLMLLLIILILGGGIFLMTKMKFEMFPQIEANRININGEVTGGKSLDFTQDKIIKLEDFILKNYNRKDLYAVITHIGDDSYKEKFSMALLLSTDDNRKLKAEKVVEDLKKKIDEIGGIIKTEFELENMGGAQMGSSVSINIAGNNNEIREKITNMIIEDLHELQGIDNLKRSDQLLKKEIKIIPRYDSVAKYGVTALNIANATKAAYDGYVVTDIRTPDETIPYRILLDDKYRKKISTLDNLKVSNNTGKLISLANMIEVEDGESLAEIRHYNGKRTTRVRFDLDTSYYTPDELYDKFNTKYNNISKQYSGFQVNLGGSAKMSSETMDELMKTMIIAIIAIFMLLIFLFRSLTQPVIVLLVIPFGLIGVAIAFLVHKMTLSFMGMMGIIGLSGVVINDSLVMVEYINQLIKKNPGINILDIVKEGAITRLRPILITSLTTFGALLPTAYGFGGKDAMVMPAAMALGWGILFGTFITLIILPTLLLIERDIRNLIMKLIRKKSKEMK